MALLLLTWVFGLLAVYSHKFFEYAFAILYATLGVFVFIVLCLNSKVGGARSPDWSVTGVCGSGDLIGH